jgi:hypothetical protein
MGVCAGDADMGKKPKEAACSVQPGAKNSDNSIQRVVSIPSIRFVSDTYKKINMMIVSVYKINITAIKDSAAMFNNRLREGLYGDVR